MFRFSLESVLKLDRQLEDRVKIKLGQTLVRYNQQVFLLEALNAELVKVQDQFRLSQGTDVDGLRQLHNFSLFMRDKIEQQTKNVQQAEQEVQKVKRELLEARREVRKLERLKEKRLEDYKYDEQRREQRILDEIAAGRFNR